jgi:archaellum biogenesis ATPase FlaH/CheY-like chemotaxis protein
MPRVLVVDDEAHVREVLRRALSQWGYEVVLAENGSDALEKFTQTRPEVVLLDITMPVMNGFEALKRIRQSPYGATTPVVLVTALPATQGEPVAMSLGCLHYISKPFEFDVLKSTIKVAAREAEALKAEAHQPPPAPPEMATAQPPASTNGSDQEAEMLKAEAHQPPPAPPEMATAQPPASTNGFDRGLLSTGIELVDEELGGGIPRQSLTLIEGPVGGGKSVLCQHLAHHLLLANEAVSYIFSEGDELTFLARMSSIGKEVSAYYEQGQLQINCLEEPILGESPEHSLALVGQRLKEVPQRYQTIIVDCITNHVAYCDAKSLVAFFQLCKSQCRSGRTICLVTHYGLFEENSWIRIHPLLDNHIRLSIKPMGRKLVKTLEVLKVSNVEVLTGSRIAFDVQSGTGILPIRLAEFSV